MWEPLGPAGRIGPAQDAGKRITVALRELLHAWPVTRQLRDGDLFGRAAASRSARSEQLRPRTADADRVVDSICPYCAVGCGQKVYVRDGEITQIEGNPDSPISRGKLCPKGSASKQLVTGHDRELHVKYRRPYATEWERLDLDTAVDMIADRVIANRREHWQQTDDDGVDVRRTMGMASLGGATMDNEENYLVKKLWTAMGAVQIENQARI
jgi:formate dehydrogenase major subunit